MAFGLDPLGVLKSMARVPRRFGDLPGDEFVRGQLGDIWDLLDRAGFDEMFLGTPVSGSLRDPRTGAPLQMNLGQPPMVGFGRPLSLATHNRPVQWTHPGGRGVHRWLRGGEHVMAPARSKGAEMQRRYRLGMLREGKRGLRDLPEVDPKQEAFRQYLLKQVGDLPRARRQLLHTTDELGALEDLEQLFPERVADQLYQNMSTPRFQALLNETLDKAGQSRAFRGRLDPDDIEDSRLFIASLIDDEISSASAAGQMRRAAKLAALRLSYERNPKFLFEQQFGRHYGEHRALRNLHLGPAHKTEGASWAELKEKALKSAFRALNEAKRRRERPEYLH